MMVREGLLRPKFQDWFPGITPGVWQAAERLAEGVAHQHRWGQPRWAPDGRALSNDHFAFRGGQQTTRVADRTRRDDPELIPQAVRRLMGFVFQHPVGFRPQRYYLEARVLTELLRLARSLPDLTSDSTAGPWFVIQGRPWLRLNERRLPLVYRARTAVVLDSLPHARIIAALFNWCEISSPARLPAQTDGGIPER
jgi:hypothetical protein